MEQLWGGAGDVPVVQHIVLLAEDAAVKGMGDTVAPAGLGEVDERGGEDGLAVRREGDLDGVVHAAGHDDVEVGSVGLGAEDVGGAVVDGGAAGAGVVLLGEGSLGPVDPPVGAEVGAVDVVGAAGEGAALEPFVADVGDAVAVGVAEAPDAGWGGDIDPSGVPEAALGEHDLVREDGGLVVAAILVGIDEAQQAVGGVLELLGRGKVGSGGIGDEEVALVVEAGADGAGGEVGGGGALEDEAVGDGEGAAFEDLVGRGENRRGGGQRKEGGKDEAVATAAHGWRLAWGTG